MSDLVFDSQVLKLSDEFYHDYSNPPYIEILNKNERPYNCLLIDTHEDYYICVPYRTEINHSYAYKFTDSARSRRHKSGLDYTKIVIISKDKYIDDAPALVDDDEYVETMRNLNRITREAVNFVDDNIKHCTCIEVLHHAEFRRRYQYSPLQYFHHELNI